MSPQVRVHLVENVVADKGRLVKRRSVEPNDLTQLSFRYDTSAASVTDTDGLERVTQSLDEVSGILLLALGPRFSPARERA